jgi:hypothetical protein
VRCLPAVCRVCIGAADGAGLMMLVLHDDVQREYAYGPAQGLPETKVGALQSSALPECEVRADCEMVCLSG